MPFTLKITGPRLLVGMFLFAVLVTAGLWGYWELHTRPFRPLTNALADHYPGSAPRVEGGKHGLHRATPRVLRVVLRVSFDPLQEEQKFQQQVQEVLQLAGQYQDLSGYQECHIHLFRQLPEQAAVLRTAKIPAEQFP